MRFPLILAVLVSITGCDSGVSIVKRSHVDLSGSTTTSQLLDNRKICKKSNWTEFKDEMGRKVVQNSCHFKDSKDFLKDTRESSLEKFSSDTKRYEQEIKEKLSELKKNITDKNKRRSEILENMAKQEILGGRYFTALDFKEKLEKLLHDNNYDDLSAYLSGMSIKWTIDTIYNYEIPNEVKALLVKTNRASSEYKASGTPSRKQSSDLKDATLDTIRVLKGFLKENDSEFKTKFKGSNELKARLNAEIDEEIEYYNQSIKYNNETLTKIKEDYKTYRPEILERYPYFDEIVEQFNWIVNDEGKSFLTGGEILAINGKEKRVLHRHTDAPSSMKLILNQNHINYKEYLSSIKTSDYIKFIESWEQKR